MENQKKPDDSASYEDDGHKRARQRRIGSQLRRLYDDVASEPIPDDFLSLLEQADHKKSAEQG